MTYIPTRAGWLYLALLQDLASRRVVGWAIGTTLETRLPLTALNRGRAARQPEAGLVHLTDCGSHYASLKYRGILQTHCIGQNMSQRGDCWDSDYYFRPRSGRSDPCLGSTRAGVFALIRRPAVAHSPVRQWDVTS